jgi:hypothetical protein
MSAPLRFGRSIRAALLSVDGAILPRKIAANNYINGFDLIAIYAIKDLRTGVRAEVRAELSSMKASPLPTLPTRGRA